MPPKRVSFEEVESVGSVSKVGRVREFGEELIANAIKEIPNIEREFGKVGRVRESGEELAVRPRGSRIYKERWQSWSIAPVLKTGVGVTPP